MVNTSTGSLIASHPKGSSALFTVSHLVIVNTQLHEAVSAQGYLLKLRVLGGVFFDPCTLFPVRGILIGGNGAQWCSSVQIQSCVEKGKKIKLLLSLDGSAVPNSSPDFCILTHFF
jgi:hypothetical protein